MLGDAISSDHTSPRRFVASCVLPISRTWFAPRRNRPERPFFCKRRSARRPCFTRNRATPHHPTWTATCPSRSLRGAFGGWRCLHLTSEGDVQFLLTPSPSAPTLHTLIPQHIRARAVSLNHRVEPCAYWRLSTPSMPHPLLIPLIFAFFFFSISDTLSSTPLTPLQNTSAPHPITRSPAFGWYCLFCRKLFDSASFEDQMGAWYGTTAFIATIVSVGPVVIVLIVILVYCCMKRRRTLMRRAKVCKS